MLLNTHEQIQKHQHEQATEETDKSNIQSNAILFFALLDPLAELI